MAIINNKVETGELTFQKLFYQQFYGMDWREKVNYDRNTDGYTKDIFFEHKDDIKGSGTYLALSQALIYLARFNMDGVPIPAKICIVNQAAQDVLVYKTADYMDIIEDVGKYVSLPASKGIEGFVERKEPKRIHFNINNVVESIELSDFIRSTKGQVKVHITDKNAWGWSRYYYDNVPKKERKKDKFFEEIRNPKGVLRNLIYAWTGKPEDFALINDLLNDPDTQKKLGCFYTPTAYCDKAAELVRQAIARVPKGNDYIILDRCAGTGNLEYALTDEEMSHVVINTYELQEWIALKNRIGKRVKCIIPPISDDDTTLPTKNEHGFLAGSNALSKGFINRPEIKQFIDDPKYTIILFENPPYRDSSASDKESADEAEEQTLNVTSFVFDEMQKHSDEFANSNVSTSRDVCNQFIWSGFEYYLRQPTDSYILLSPAKCFKSLGLLNYEFGGGYLFNREHFHASPASIMCTLWYNKKKSDIESIKVTAYDINKMGHLEKLKDIEIKKVHKTFEPYFDRRRFDDDIEVGVYCETDGTETKGRKCDGKSIYNLGTVEGRKMVAYCRTINYPISAMNRYFTRQASYGARGFYIREDNFLEKLPLFVAKSYPLREWCDKEVFMTSSDGGENYSNDHEFLKECLIYTCLSNGNKCISFNGSDGHYYRNELCLDGNTLASNTLKSMHLTDVETELIEKYKGILSEIKRKRVDGKYLYEEYNPEYSYGIHQISLEIDINIPKTDENGNIIYKKENKNGKMKPEVVKKYGKNLSNIINPLQRLLDDYYMGFIAPKMFKYELVK